MLLSAQSRKKLIESVKKKEKTVSQACKEVGISRKTFYKWLKRYEIAPTHKKLYVLTDKVWNLKRHGRKTPTHIEKHVLSVVAKFPNLGSREIRNKLLDKIGTPFLSNHAISNILERYELKDVMARNLYRNDKKKNKLTFQDRYLAIEAIVKEDNSISRASRDLNISRKTLYKWLKRYQYTKEFALETFKEKDWKIKKHPRLVPEEVKEKIIKLVIEKPELSSHSLSVLVGIGNHGVQNVLTRNNLNLYNLRLAYSKVHSQPEKAPVFAWLYDRIRLVLEQFVPSLAPAPPPFGSRFIKPFFASSIFTFLISFSLLSWIRFPLRVICSRFGSRPIAVSRLSIGGSA